MCCEPYQHMRVFISHKQEDEDHARAVKSILDRHYIDSYLDVLDLKVSTQSGPGLTAYIIGQLKTCTHIIPVVTDKTERSWWVPFEIGVATEQGRVIATYTPNLIGLPDFLQEWPHLGSTAEVNEYAKLASSKKSLFSRENYENKAILDKRNTARSFESDLKQKLVSVRRGY